MDEKSDKTSEKQRKLSEAGLELKKALDAWEDLSKQNLGVSADEQMLEDMHSLLKRIKTQIEEFR